MQSEERGLIAWFARHDVAANLLMFVIIMGGVYSAFHIEKEMFPDISPQQIIVRVSYPSAASAEVETGILTLIEEAVADIEGIKEMNAKASESVGEVLIDVTDGYDVETVLAEIKQAIEAVSTFPDTAESPYIARVKRKNSVISLQIYGDLSETHLKALAQEIKDELIQLPEISTVEIFGTRAYEIRISLSEPQMDAYGLTFAQVAQTLREASIDLPGGLLKTQAGERLLRINSQAKQGTDFANLVLLTRADGSQIRLSDIAEVHDDFAETDIVTRFNSKPSVSLQVQSVGDQNDLEIAAQVRNYVTTKQKQLPEQIKLAYWGDRSFYLQGRLNLMLDNMKIGAFLVFIILTFFLEWRLAIWVVLGIPISFCGALLLMPLIDVSISVISLFGFILVLGIVVDDAIVIGESAYTEVERHGTSPEAIIRGAQAIAMPATFGVLTTIAAFAPMLLSTNPDTTFIRHIAWVVTLCLIFSLIESKLILPAHLVATCARLGHSKKTTRQPEKRSLKNAFAWLQGQVDRLLQTLIRGPYQTWLQRAITHRYATLLFFTSLFVLAIALMVGGLVRQVIFPNIASDFIEVSLEMETGVTAEQTAATLAVIEEALVRTHKQMLQEKGIGVVVNYYGVSTSETDAWLTAELTKSEDRTLTTFEITRAWREQLPVLVGVKNLIFNNTIGPGGKDLSFMFRAKDLDQLQVLTTEVKQLLSQYQGVYDIEDSLSGGKSELVISLKPEAHLYGLTMHEVAKQLRQGFYGEEVQRFIREGEEVKVMVKYPEADRSKLGFLDEVRMRTTTGEAIPLWAIANLKERQGVGQINRVNGFRSVRIYAALDAKVAAPERVQQDIEQQLETKVLPKYTGVHYERTGRAKSRDDTQKEMLLVFLASLIGIYVLLAVPLQSYWQPLIVMSAIPFGLIGALVGHALLGLDLSNLSMFGMIALTGVVVNDSLILVSTINQWLSQGRPLHTAVMAAGGARFRAIVLTSLTTFVGLVPILAETSLQAQIVIPMATSLAFGILFATVIILFLVPCLYVILQDSNAIKERWRREWAALMASRVDR